MKLKTLSLDIFFLTFLFGISIFLIGYYLNYEYLITGYQDWIYHAFRIKSLSEYGITSWDHKWANGINYWQVYQHIQHILAERTSMFLNVSPSKSMLIWTVTLFLYMRAAIYLVLRKIGINPLYSFLGVLSSFLFSQQWQSMKEFSIFFSLAILPIFLYLWIKATASHKFYYLVGSAAGLSWILHPVLGFSLTSLLSLDLFFNKKLGLAKKVVTFLLVGLTSLSFFLEYFTIAYRFTNPVYVTQDFINIMLTTKTFGLGSLFLIFIGLSWIVFLLKPAKFKYWTKILLVYLTGMIFLFLLASNGYTPELLNKVQFQRANLIIGFLSVFLFASCYQIILGNTEKVNSKLIYIIVSGITAIAITSAADISSIWTADATHEYSTNIGGYFNNKQILGTVYFEDESLLSYFTRPDIRLVGSYNEHLLPSPVSFIFKKLLRTHSGYTSITETQMSLIKDYINVLGVEYLVVPHSSPLVEATKEGRADFLVEDGEITTLTAKYTVLRNTRDIHYAYIIDLDKYKEFVGDQNIEDPDLNINSIDPWNNHINKLSKFFDSEDATPIGLEFIFPNSLSIKTGQTLPGYKNSAIYVTQSYDKNWHTNASDTVISATPLHFMQINSQLKSGQIITLTNTWPAWHWPVEALAPATFLLTGAATVGYSLFSKGKDNENENK